MTTPASGNDSGRGPGLAHLLDILRRRRALAVLPFLFVLAAAASLAFFLPGLWTAKALILVDRQQVPEAFVKPTVNNDVESQLLTLSQQILSRAQLLRIAQEYNLYPDLRRSRTPEEIVEQMRRDIRIEIQGDNERARRTPDSRTIAFSVSYSAPSPVIAQRVTNRLAALYVEENSRARERQAAGTSEFLETQLAEVRGRLQAQERKITDYKEKYLGELPEQREANTRTLERLQQQLQIAGDNNRRAEERRQLLTRTLADIDQSVDLPTTGATAGPNPTPAEAAAARLSLMRQELAEMKTRYSDKYPDVIALKQQIAVAEAETAALAKKQRPAAVTVAKRTGKEPPQNAYVQSLMSQLDQATVEAKATREEIANLGRQMTVYQRHLENTPKREQELNLITRDYETTRELFRSLLAKRGEAEIAADLEQRQKGENFRIIDPAALPERPTGPNRLRLLLVGLVLGLAASGIAVVVSEQIDTSYRTVEELRASVPAPVLSTIPRIATEADRTRSQRQRRLAAAAVAIGLLAVIGSSAAIAHDNHALVGLLSPADTLNTKR